MFFETTYNSNSNTLEGVGKKARDAKRIAKGLAPKFNLPTLPKPTQKSPIAHTPPLTPVDDTAFKPGPQTGAEAAGEESGGGLFGSISPTMLLIGGGLALFLLMKR